MQNDRCARHDAPGFLATHAERLFTRLVDARLRPHGISLAQLSPLLLLARSGPLLQRDLVAGSAIAQPAMVALLGKLEAAGFIVRSPHAGDRRAALIALTPAGKKLVRAAGPMLERTNRDALAGFSDTETATLTALMQRLIRNLEAAD